MEFSSEYTGLESFKLGDILLLFHCLLQVCLKCLYLLGLILVGHMCLKIYHLSFNYLLDFLVYWNIVCPNDPLNFTGIYTNVSLFIFSFINLGFCSLYFGYFGVKFFILLVKC